MLLHSSPFYVLNLPGGNGVCVAFLGSLSHDCTKMLPVSGENTNTALSDSENT